MRGLPLALRPLIIILEGMFSSESILTITMPTAMIILAISSIPVQKKLYINGLHKKKEYSNYVTNLAVILTATLLFISPILFLILINENDRTLEIGMLIVVTWLIEKISDEESRRYEYLKVFSKWFIIQMVRTGWPLVSFLIYFGTSNWGGSLLLVGFPLALALVILFLSEKINYIKWRSFNKDDFIDGGYLVVGSTIPALAINIPRLQVAVHIPDYANVYLAISQILSIIPILYDVLFSIKRRKLISIKPKKFYNTLKAKNIKIMFFAISIFTISVISEFYFPYYLDYKLTILYMAALLLAEILIYTLLNFNLNIIFWHYEGFNAFKYYFIVLTFIMTSYFISFDIITDLTKSIFSIPITSFTVIFTAYLLTMNFLQNEHRKK